MESVCGDKHATEETSHQEDECACVAADHLLNMPQSLGQRYRSLDPMHSPNANTNQSCCPLNANALS
jgi:hypothetical protein